MERDWKGVLILDKTYRKSIDFKEVAATIPLRIDVTRWTKLRGYEIN